MLASSKRKVVPSNTKNPAYKVLSAQHIVHDFNAAIRVITLSLTN